MRSFRSKRTVPPSGYFYVVPETNAEILAGDFDSLLTRIRIHYGANKIPAPANLPAIVENFLCLRNPESFCSGELEPGDNAFAIVDTREVKEATRMVNARLKWSPDKFLAPITESEARAKICFACSENHRGFCTTCNGLKDYVVKAIGARTTSYDDRLGVCSHCSCLLTAKVHISKAALREVTPTAERAKYPAHCWMQHIEEDANGKEA